MSGVSLNAALDRPLRKTQKLKHGLLWKPQEVADVRVMGYLMRKATNREWKNPKRENKKVL